MTTKLLPGKNAIRLAAFAAFVFSISGCMKKDLYDPAPETPAPTPDVYFDFSTSSELPLTINFGIQDHRVMFEIYDKNPLTIIDDYTFEKTKELEPLFAGYTDWNSAYSGTIKLPAALDKVYLYTDGFGIPGVHELTVTPAGISFVQNLSATGVSTRAASYTFDFNSPAGSNANLYHVSSPLGKWDATGSIQAQVNSNVIQGLTSRVQKIAAPTANNTTYAKGKKFTNLVTYKETVVNPNTGKTEGGTELKVKFLWEFAGYHNVLGYYYYPKGATLTDEAFRNLPKYLVFPNVSWNETYAGNTRANLRPDYGCIPLVEGSSVSVQYYGNDYNQTGTTAFPKDIEIGWFMMSDAFYTADKGTTTKSNINGYLESDAQGNKTHMTYIGSGTTTGRPGSIYGNPNHLPYVFSNEEFNTNKVPGCITLYDDVSKAIVIGFEDGDARTYQDFLFYVEAIPGVINPGWDLTEKIVESPVKSSYAGALAFEDYWPKKGDYDLNDVIINYHSDVITDANNNVIELVDTFTVVNDGAMYTNAFGYELGISPSAIESVTVDRKGVSSSFKTDAKGLELGQNGKSVIMLFDNHAQAMKKSIVVHTKIKSSAAIKLGTNVLYPPYNPFIVARSNENSRSGRKEVHLPKVYRPTDLAGSLGESDDVSTQTMWYISSPDKNGVQYPFALHIPFDAGFHHFISPTEGLTIETDYPAFLDWTKSNGVNYKTWYKQNSKVTR